MTIELMPLPYSIDALAPAMSAQTLTFHHGKHHAGYVAKLNGFIEGTEFANSALEDIIVQSANKADKKAIFQNAAQIWNHQFFWNSMAPKGGGKPEGKIADLINKSFGSFDKFSEEFQKQAASHFGSGWAWLTLSGDGVEMTTTHDADLPLAHGKTALICCDVWEHAYYLDFQNNRPGFVKSFLENLVNWDFANENLAAAK